MSGINLEKTGKQLSGDEGGVYEWQVAGSSSGNKELKENFAIHKWFYRFYQALWDFNEAYTTSGEAWKSRHDQSANQISKTNNLEPGIKGSHIKQTCSINKIQDIMNHEMTSERTDSQLTDNISNTSKLNG
ncbi:hypothetical protein BY996DRAFT_6596322 [Phakopsora pachyrhizi]|nr:hypothetical protein BY996DRAFT_6596322 [Phakopsora pachyrhizi]